MEKMGCMDRKGLEGGQRCFDTPKGLEMVRNIYNELLKTADFKECIEIERYATLSESLRRREAFVKAASWIPALNISTDDLDIDPWLLNVNRCRL